MKRLLGWVAAASLAGVAVNGGAAQAQFGYGGYGWGGWGGGSTVAGDQMRGAGQFAAGAGVYNYNTSIANNINAQTAMQMNEYIYQSKMEAGRIMRQNDLIRRKENLTNYNAIQDRIRNNPTESDVMRGDALNSALDELIAPKVYLNALRGAKAQLPGTVIREIPFNSASEAITLSVDDIVKSGPPDLLKGPEFAEDRAALAAISKKVRSEVENQQPVDTEAVAKAQALIKKIDKQIVDDPDKYKRFSRPVTDARNYLRGLYGLMSMLETPAINVLLAGVEKRPDTNIGDLLQFMHAFNLRFGPARTPQQRAIYTQLYGSLDRLRDELVATAPPPSGPVAKDAPSKFFSGMDLQEIDTKKAAPPAPRPGPGPGASQP